MFPFYIFAILALVFVTISGDVARETKSLIRNPATTMAETVLAAHSSAVSVSDGPVRSIDHDAGGTAEIDTRYWNASDVRSIAFVAPSTGEYPAGEFVLTWLPPLAMPEAQIRRVAGYVSSAATRGPSVGGIYDATATVTYGNGYLIPAEAGIADGSVYVITDVAPE